MSELITEKIDETEQIVEKIDEDTEQIDSSPERISEIMPEKRRYRSQRGRDRTSRRVGQNSMMNLKPYMNEVIASEENTDVQLPDKTVKVIDIILLFVIIGIIIWKVIERNDAQLECTTNY